MRRSEIRGGCVCVRDWVRVHVCACVKESMCVRVCVSFTYFLFWVTRRKMSELQSKRRNWRMRNVASTEKFISVKIFRVLILRLFRFISFDSIVLKLQILCSYVAEAQQNKLTIKQIKVSKKLDVLLLCCIKGPFELSEFFRVFLFDYLCNNYFALTYCKVR